MMRAGLVFLVAGYVLSQFYRAFLAVLAPALQADIGAGPADLALSSGLLVPDLRADAAAGRRRP